MVYDLPVEEEKVKPHQITTLHLVCAMVLVFALLPVATGTLILRLLKNPLEVLWDTVRRRTPEPRWRDAMRFGCSMTLAGYGYPHLQVRGPSFPVEVRSQFDCDVWWNEVARGADGKLMATGHRTADVIALAPKLDAAIAKAIAESGATSIKQMGAVVKAAKAQLEGKTVDGKALSDLVRERLSKLS